MPKNLLLADDSRTIQQAVSLTFAREDIRVVSVSDGEAALQAARQQRPDVILADVSMPRLGGYELCQKLRADAGLKDIPVLLLGGGAPVDPSKALAVGANGLMPKPFDSAKLIDQVKQILANPKARPSSAPPPPAAATSKPPPGAAAKPAIPSTPPRPGAAPSTASTTNVMARPPMPSRPPGPAAPAARPGSLPPPTAKPPMPGAKAPTAPPPARPAAAIPPAKVAAAAAPARSAPPAARPPAAPAKPAAPVRPPPPVEDDEDISVDDDLAEESPAPTPLRPVAAPAGSKPSLSVVPPPGKASDGGEALLREALSKASREVIEKIAWEVVPELAETIIREELERLIKERGA